jgi:hypothetical protein
VRLPGAVWDQAQRDQLYAHALTYVHGHSVGGTNPSLLRAMGAGTATLAYDVSFNRDVLGEDGRFFRTAAELAALLEQAEAAPAAVRERALLLQQRAEQAYRWDDVADRYEKLCRQLAQGVSTRGRASGRRAAAPATSAAGATIPPAASATPSPSEPPHLREETESHR